MLRTRVSVASTHMKLTPDNIYGKKYVTDPGDSSILHPGMIVSTRKLRDENSILKRRDLKPAEARDAIPATPNHALQGITMCDNGPHEMGSPGIGSREHHDDVIG